MYPTSTILNFETYRRGGYVSVWVGNFGDELDLDDYLGPKFEADFGFSLNARDMPEVTVEERKPIQEIVEGFSRSKTFKEELCETARLLGIASATTLVVFYNFCYTRSESADTASKPLRFLGAFRFRPSD